MECRNHGSQLKYDDKEKAMRRSDLANLVLQIGTSLVIRSIMPQGYRFSGCSILTRFSRHASVEIWRSPCFIVVAAISLPLGERRHSQAILKRLLQSSSEILHCYSEESVNKPASVLGPVCDGSAQERFDATRNR